MNKEEYSKALKSPEWIIKRDKIKKRDGYKCVKCSCNEELHVHHKYYLPDKMPWEVPDDCLITLCRVCHEKEHRGRDISSFIRTTPPNKKKQTKTDKKEKVSKTPSISRTDRELQDKYDLLRSKGKLPDSTYKPLENPPRNIPKRRRKKKRK